MICPHCGAELKDSAKFCTKCGTPQQAQPSQETEALQTAAAATTVVQAAEPVPEVAEPVPEAVEPVPETVEPAPEAVEPVPETVEPAPEVAEPAPEAVETTPEAVDSAEEVAPVEENVPDEAAAETENDEFVEEDQAEQAEEKAETVTPLPKEEKKGHKVLSVLLCILLFLSAFCACLIGVVRIVFSEESVEKMINKVDLNDIDLRNAKTGEPIEMSEYILSLCDDKTVEKYNLTADDIEDIIKKIEWQDSTSEIASAYVGYFLNGEELKIEAKDIVKIIKDNEEVFSDYGNGFKFNYDKLEKKIDDSFMPMLDLNQSKGIVATGVKLVTYAFSLLTLIICLLVSAFFIFLILLANRFRVLPTLGYVGMTAIVLGALQLIGAAGGIAVAKLIGIELLDALLVTPMFTLLFVGLGCLVAGILMFVLSCVLTSVMRKKRMKTA